MRGQQSTLNFFEHFYCDICGHILAKYHAIKIRHILQRRIERSLKFSPEVLAYFHIFCTWIWAHFSRGGGEKSPICRFATQWFLSGIKQIGRQNDQNQCSFMVFRVTSVHLPIEVHGRPNVTLDVHENLFWKNLELLFIYQQSVQVSSGGGRESWHFKSFVLIF